VQWRSWSYVRSENRCKWNTLVQYRHVDVKMTNEFLATSSQFLKTVSQVTMYENSFLNLALRWNQWFWPFKKQWNLNSNSSPTTVNSPLIFLWRLLSAYFRSDNNNRKRNPQTLSYAKEYKTENGTEKLEKRRLLASYLLVVWCVEVCRACLFQRLWPFVSVRGNEKTLAY
jgi:hypothetical protein